MPLQGKLRYSRQPRPPLSQFVEYSAKPLTPTAVLLSFEFSLQVFEGGFAQSLFLVFVQLASH